MMLAGMGTSEKVECPACGHSWTDGHPQISPREREILILIGAGQTTRQIANALFISESTVKAHIQGIFEKLSCRTRGQAVLQALRDGLFSPADVHEALG